MTNRVIICAVLSFLCVFIASGSELDNTSRWNPFNSKILNETRQYALYLPRSYEDDLEKHYPVMYVLDGSDVLYNGITGMVETLSTDFTGNQIPEFIIIAISNTDRWLNFSPTKSNLEYKKELLLEVKNSGGANTFLKFLENELIPHINNNYRTNDTRLLVGHSFGGLFTAHVLLEKPKLFSEYLIIDATYIWDNNYINRRAETLFNDKKELEAKVYLSLANNNDIGEKGLANLRWGREFAKRLKDHSTTQLVSKSRFFKNEKHATVAPISWYYGLLYLYKNE